jgi:hypothetical protein
MEAVLDSDDTDEDFWPYHKLGVMAGLDPAIHDSVRGSSSVDDRVKPGHDERRELAPEGYSSPVMQPPCINPA